jgi:hypothetical protein
MQALSLLLLLLLRELAPPIRSPKSRPCRCALRSSIMPSMLDTESMYLPRDSPTGSGPSLGRHHPTARRSLRSHPLPRKTMIVTTSIDPDLENGGFGDVDIPWLDWVSEVCTWSFNISIGIGYWDWWLESRRRYGKGLSRWCIRSLKWVKSSAGGCAVAIVPYAGLACLLLLVSMI